MELEMIIKRMVGECRSSVTDSNMTRLASYFTMKMNIFGEKFFSATVVNSFAMLHTIQIYSLSMYNLIISCTLSIKVGSSFKSNCELKKLNFHKVIFIFLYFF